MLDELKKVPKRPRGRPKGSQTKPKTIEELIARADSYKPAPRKLKRAPTSEEPYFKRLKIEDPERMKAISIKGNQTPRPPRLRGKPHHMSYRQWAVTLDEGQKLAKKIMKNIEGDLPENVIAREAMKEAITLLSSEISIKDKLAVINTLLAYNMAKPASTQNVNVKTAEDFLDELAENE